MNRSPSSSSPESGAANQAYGTLAPNVNPSPGVPTPQAPLGVEQPASAPAYQTYSPPQGPGGTERDLPSPERFSQVYKTNGSDTESNLLDAYSTQFDDDGDCIETMEVPMEKFKDSDFIKTIDTPHTGTNRLPPDPKSDSYRTIELPNGGTGQIPSPIPQPPPRSKTGGKSTWQLQIRPKSLKGYVSGIRNRIPETPDQAEGFMAAFLDNPEVAEYEVLSELGKGNMGIVYEAKQSSLNRELAIKSLNPKEGSAQYEQEMFVSEAVVTANLVHPNIVPIHDLGRTEDGKLFYSMKKVTGVSWDKTIREKSLEDNLDIFMKVCDAVAYAHSRGVVNRDLKPENVVIGAYGEVVVLDWGLAVTNERFPKQESILLDYRGGAGTPVYMAPELVSDDISSVGEHSDIYLLGAILFEVLEGFPPHLLRAFWELENPQEQFASIVTAVMTNQIETQVTNPGELMDIAFKAMATNPADRFHSVEEMQEYVRQYRITGHAEEFYRAAASDGKKQSYDNYQASVALFSEALRKWPNNERATLGDKLARKGFAELALVKGDFDLGLHLIEGKEEPEFRSLRKNLKGKRQRRAVVKWTWSALAIGIVLLGAFTALQYQTAQAAIAEADLRKTEAEEAQKLAQEEQEKAVAAKAEADDALQAKRDAEALTAEAIKQTEIAEKELEVKQAEIVQVNKEANEAKIEAEKQTMLAAMKAQEAAEKTKEAEVATAKADKELKKAAGALMAAAEAEKKAEAAAALAKEAEAAKAEAQVALLDVEWNKFNLEYEQYITLGQYEEALNVVRLALEKAKIAQGAPGFNQKFVRRKPVIERRLRELEAKRTSYIRPLEGDLKNAVVSRSGRVAAYSTLDKIEILYTPAGAESSLANYKTSRYEDLQARVHLDISADENFVVATGKNYKRLWSLKSGTPVDFALTDQFPPTETGKVEDYRVAHFSPDSQWLFIVSGDDRLTLEVYDLSSGFPKAHTRTSIVGKSNNVATITDFFLVPDAAPGEMNSQSMYLIYLTGNYGTSTCSWAKIERNDDTFVVADRDGLGDTRDPEFRQLTMKGLVVAPNRERMAVQVGDRHVRVFNRLRDEEKEVPFEAPEEHATFTCDNTITSLAFSDDGNQLLVGIQNGYAELWTWNAQNQSFQPHQPGDEIALWKGHRIGGLSEKPLIYSFVDGQANTVLAVGLGNQSDRKSGYRLIRWDLSSYEQEYVDSIKSFEEDLFGEPILQTRLDQHDEPLVHLVRAPAPSFNYSQLQTVAVYQEEKADEEDTENPWRVSRSVDSARFSEDGQRIVVAADDRAAHVFARNRATVMITGGRRSRFYEPERNIFEEGHIPELAEIMFLPPDGKRLLTKDYFGAVSVWDASIDEDGYAREVSRMLTSDFGLAVSPDGKWVLASARDIVEAPNDEGELEDQQIFVAKLWDTKDFETNPSPDEVRTFSGEHTRLITAVAISPDSTTIATADRRGNIVVWDLMTAEVIAKIRGQHDNDQISGIAFLNENELISTGFDGRIRRWVINQEELVSVDERFQFLKQDNFDDYIISLKMSPDRRKFATVGVQKSKARGEKRNIVHLDVWTLDSPQEPKQLFGKLWPETKSEFDQGVSWTADGKSLGHIYPVAADLGKDFVSELTLYETENWTVTKKYRPKGLTGTSSKIAFSPNQNEDKTEQIATFDGRVAHLWNLDNREHVVEFRSHERVYSADFSVDRRLVITGSDSVRIFVGDENLDTHGSTVIRMTEAHAGRIEEVRFTDQPGKYDFLTFGGDRQIKLWNWNWTPAGPNLPPTQAAVTMSLESMEDQQSGDWDPNLTWNSSLDWSKSGNLIAATFAGQLYLFQKQGEGYIRIPLKLPEGIIARFHSCDLSEDESLIMAGGAKLGEDGRSVENFSAIWRLRDGAAPFYNLVFEGNHTPVRNEQGAVGTTAVKFAADSLNVFTGGTDGRLNRWDWESGLDLIDEIEEAELVEEITIDSRAPHGTATINSIDVTNAGDILSAGSNGTVALFPGAEGFGAD